VDIFALMAPLTIIEALAVKQMLAFEVLWVPYVGFLRPENIGLTYLFRFL